MTALPPVVSDPEGPCPERPNRTTLGNKPHDWVWGTHRPTAFDRMICRYCGGRKPERDALVAEVRRLTIENHALRHQIEVRLGPEFVREALLG